MNRGEIGAAVITTKDVGGRVFKWGSSFNIDVYKGGHVQSLKEVYEAGGITEDDLDQILKHHKAYFEENHAWDYDAE